MKKLLFYIFVIFIATSSVAYQERLVWPSAPDQARMEFVDQIDLNKLKVKSSLFGKIKRFIGGASESEQLSLPFDIIVNDKNIFLTCQNIPALIQIIRKDNEFRIHTPKDNSLLYPIAICDDSNGTIFLTDSKSGIIFKFDGTNLTAFIENNLVRPTGIAAIYEQNKIYIIDTGEHSLKVFDYDGKLIKTVSQFESEENFHYPTFIEATANNEILINDALNYEIRRFDYDGNYLSSFGKEGDAPGTFSRPKGIAVDSDGHIYIVDNMFDNIQVFDKNGRILLVIGSRGQNPGQFWSPVGICIKQDTLFIADTFNNRIQILHYLGENN
ncbi:MAG: hypothetical protein DRP35_01520 [Candidatus Zixiibacteriota bacterium]|nr:MAG: hypothetical protein DRP35_01520 [candidate division Zixibacteria bacterium]